MTQAANANIQDSTVTQKEIDDFNHNLKLYERYLEDPQHYYAVDRMFNQFYSLAERGYAPAQYRVGLAFKKGEGEVSQRDDTAVRRFEEASEQGYAPAQFHLGEMYEEGRYVAKDYNEALKLYHKSAEQGYGEAQYKLGKMYQKGEHLPESYSHAYTFISLAKTNGYQSETLQQELDEARKLLSDTNSDVIDAQKKAVESWEMSFK